MARITRSLAKADATAAAEVVAFNKEAHKTYEPRARTRRTIARTPAVHRRAPAPAEAEDADADAQNVVVVVEAPATPPRRANPQQQAVRPQAAPGKNAPAAPAHPLPAPRQPRDIDVLVIDDSDDDDEAVLAAAPVVEAHPDELAAQLEELNFGLGARAAADDDDEVMTLIGSPMSNMKIDLLKSDDLEAGASPFARARAGSSFRRADLLNPLCSQPLPTWTSRRRSGRTRSSCRRRARRSLPVSSTWLPRRWRLRSFSRPYPLPPRPRTSLPLCCTSVATCITTAVPYPLARSRKESGSSADWVREPTCSLSLACQKRLERFSACILVSFLPAHLARTLSHT